MIMLLVTTMLWGTAFAILKETLTKLPTFFILTVRFFLSGILIGLIFIKRFKGLSRRTLVHGLILGVVLFFAYGTQTVGLRYTTPARNAFITVAYCIMTPFLAWAMYKRRPHSYNVISGVVCLLGLAFISLIGQADDGGLHLLGDGLTVFAALFFAFQLVFIEHYIEEGDDPFVLLFFELAVSGAMFALVSVCYELPTLGPSAYVIPADCWWRLGYLMAGCSLLAQLFQMLGQRYTTSSQASIILSFESVFAAVFSVALGMERLTVFLIIGFILVFAAGLISELHFDPVALWHHMLHRAVPVSADSVVPAREEDAGAEPQASEPLAVGEGRGADGDDGDASPEGASTAQSDAPSDGSE